jgi:hypothetical protein
MWPLILALAGAGLQYAGAKRAEDKSNDKLQAELARQAAYRQRAQAIASQNITTSGADTANTQIDEGATRRRQAYENTQSVPLVSSAAAAPLQRSATSQSTQRQQGEQERSNQTRAGLMGYSEWELQQAIKNLLANQQLGLINNAAAGSQSVLPLELDAASHAGDSLAGAGQLLGTAGMMWGLGNAFAAPSPALTSGQTAAFSAGAGPVSPAGATAFFNSTPTVANPWAGNLGYFASPLVP